MREVIVFSALALVWFAWRALNAATLRDPLSPFNLLFYCWIVPLIGSFLEWSRLQDGFGAEGATLIAVSTAILIGGCLMPACFLGRRNLGASLERYGRSWEGSLYLRLFVVLFFLITCAATLSAEFGRGIPLFQYANVLATDSDLHRYGKDSKLEILGGGLATAGLLGFYVARCAHEKRTKWLFYGIAAIPPFLGILKTSKSDVFDSLFYYAVLYYYSLRSQNRPFRFKKMAIWSLAGAVSFAAMTMLRLAGDSRNPTLTYSGMIEFRYVDDVPWPINEALAIPYGYATLNFENFSRYVRSSNGQSHWGASMLRPLLSATLQGSIARTMVKDYEANYHELTGAANMGTYLRDLYFEGGAWFCLIGTFLYTALVNLAYVQFRKRQSPLWMCIYINFLFAWIWIGFNNFFAVLTIYANAVFMAMVVIAGAILSKAVPQAQDSPATLVLGGKPS
ncbi:MAG TPA: O-antigen polymerase [Terriglobales bacterium]|nr:O-antigen polymerase [Terriglobales bacterium]